MKSVLQRRTCIILALSVPGMLIMLNAAYGQRRGPGPGPVIIRPNVPPPMPPRPFVPPTPQQPPVFVPGPPQQVWITVWSCSNCRAELARGGGPPAINTCPSCGANLVNQVPVQAQVQNPLVASGDSSIGAAVWVGVGVSVLLLIGGVIAIVVVCRRPLGLDLKNFERLAKVEFEQILTRHGFALESASLNQGTCDIIFGNGERYVWISAKTQVRDRAAYFNVFLGEGDRDLAARRANAISLGEMKALQEGEGEATDGKYILRQNKPVRRVLERANDDLASYEGGFLAGRTEKLHEAQKLLTHEKDISDLPFAEEVAILPEGIRVQSSRGA